MVPLRMRSNCELMKMVMQAMQNIMVGPLDFFSLGVYMGAFDKLPCVDPAVLTRVSPWQELIEQSLTLLWWRHVPGASPQVTHSTRRVLGADQGEPLEWRQSYTNVPGTDWGQTGVDPGKLIERTLCCNRLPTQKQFNEYCLWLISTWNFLECKTAQHLYFCSKTRK